VTRIGIFGGTFDPIHYGHLMVAQQVKEELALDKVLFVPTYLPPHKEYKNITAGSYRLEMLKLALKGNTSFEVSTVELRRKGVSYTFETLLLLEKENPAASFYIIIGSDLLEGLLKWYKIYAIFSKASFVVFQRCCFRIVDIELPAHFKKKLIFLKNIITTNISSSKIREYISKGRHIGYLLPFEVKEYIRENKLYGC